MKKVRILCVGIGGYATLYIDALLKSGRSDFELVGLVDPYPQTSRLYAQLSALKLPLYPTIEEFFEKEGDIAELAVITTPIHLHTAQTLCALEHGCNVMCEKPMSGVSTDEALIEAAARRAGRFVGIGYQWSYSPAINTLKADIRSGMYGEPVMLKSLVHWPRAKQYFTRSSGWAGRITSPDGAIINDSVANNAAAHYLHNILYVTGEHYGESREVLSLRADLIRVNAIENFDTAAISLELSGGGRGLFIASHSTMQTREPRFDYLFTNGSVSFTTESGDIVGRTRSGAEKHYGNPFENQSRKVFDAIDAILLNDADKPWDPPCGVRAAAAHVRCVEMLQREPIFEARLERVRETDERLYLDGLDELLCKCYERELLPSDMPEYEELIRHG